MPDTQGFGCFLAISAAQKNASIFVKIPQNTGQAIWYDL